MESGTRSVLELVEDDVDGIPEYDFSDLDDEILGSLNRGWTSMESEEIFQLLSVCILKLTLL